MRHPTITLRPQTVLSEHSTLPVRVFNNIDVFGASGIYERMFIYARDPAARSNSK